jgi:predicted nucleic acid-binding protein
VSVPDVLHVAVMACHDITELMGLDGGFDAYPGINGLT